MIQQYNFVLSKINLTGSSMAAFIGAKLFSSRPPLLPFPLHILFLIVQ